MNSFNIPILINFWILLFPCPNSHLLHWWNVGQIAVFTSTAFQSRFLPLGVSALWPQLLIEEKNSVMQYRSCWLRRIIRSISVQNPVVMYLYKSSSSSHCPTATVALPGSPINPIKCGCRCRRCPSVPAVDALTLGTAAAGGPTATPELLKYVKMMNTVSFHFSLAINIFVIIIFLLYYYVLIRLVPSTTVWH